MAPAFAGHRAPSSDTPTKTAPGASYRAQVKLWDSERHVIANTFRSAVAAARRTFNIAKSQAVTSADRYAARTAFEAAIALAAENRSAQLIALGPPPSPSVNADSRHTSLRGANTRR